MTFSRILSEQEVLIVANTSTQKSWAGAVLVDENLNPVGKELRVLYGNRDQFEMPGPVVERPAGSVEITEIDRGSVMARCISSLSMCDRWRSKSWGSRCFSASSSTNRTCMNG